MIKRIKQSKIAETCQKQSLFPYPKLNGYYQNNDVCKHLSPCDAIVHNFIMPCHDVT